MMKNKISLILLLVLATYSGCNKDFLDRNDPNRLTTDKFYKTERDAIEATNAAYSALNTQPMYMREYWYLLDLLSDELLAMPQLELKRQQVHNLTMSSDNDLVTNVWGGLYIGVLRANAAIEKIPTIKMDEALKTRLLAECRFLRAFYYFELTTLWGAVPLITKVPTTGNYSYPRTPVAEVDKLIEEDFKFAVNNLKKKSEYSLADMGRATQGAAKGFLGKFYLYRKRYAESAAVLKQIIDSGEYELVDNYLHNFDEQNENNRESLFEVQFQSGILGGSVWGDESAGSPNGEGSFRSSEYGVNAFGNVRMSEQYADLMGNDPRSKYTFYQYGTTWKEERNKIDTDVPYRDFERDATGALILDANGGKKPINRYAIRKYSIRDRSSSEIMDYGVNFRVLRFADVLLMYAEAVNEASGPTEAYAAVNRVRNRVGLSGLPTGLNKPQMFDAIVRERALELALEQVRAKDIRRWGIAGTVLAVPGKRWNDATKGLLPIPQKEIDANDAIGPNDQNPGY